MQKAHTVVNYSCGPEINRDRSSSCRVTCYCWQTCRNRPEPYKGEETQSKATYFSNKIYFFCLLNNKDKHRFYSLILSSRTKEQKHLLKPWFLKITLIIFLIFSKCNLACMAGITCPTPILPTIYSSGGARGGIKPGKKRPRRKIEDITKTSKFEALKKTV